MGRDKTIEELLFDLWIVFETLLVHVYTKLELHELEIHRRGIFLHLS